MRTIRVGIAGLLVLALACSESDPTSTAIPQEGAADVPAGDMAATTTGARAYGVDAESHVVLFRLDRPGQVSQRMRITGTGGRKVVGIDSRPSAVAPATPDVIGKLYGLRSRCPDRRRAGCLAHPRRRAPAGAHGHVLLRRTRSGA